MPSPLSPLGVRYQPVSGAGPCWSAFTGAHRLCLVGCDCLLYMHQSITVVAFLTHSQDAAEPAGRLPQLMMWCVMRSLESTCQDLPLHNWTTQQHSGCLIAVNQPPVVAKALTSIFLFAYQHACTPGCVELSQRKGTLAPMLGTLTPCMVFCTLSRPCVGVV
jgi:hypothetical protein